MSVALIGVISLQLYWIFHDIRLKEQQFNQSVNQAMNSVVDRIERTEAMNILYDRVFNLEPQRISQLIIRDTTGINPINITDTSIEIVNLPGYPPPIMEDLDNADINIEFHKPGSTRSIMTFQTRKYVHRDSLMQKTIKSSRLTRIYGDSTEIVIRQNEEKIKARLEKFNQVMEKLAVEFAGPDNDIKSRLDSSRLDSLIKLELKNRGIDVNVNYGVLNGKSGALILNRSTIPQEELLKSKYKVILFPNDIGSKPDFLILHFPSTISYVLESMWLMLAGSAAFTLTILFSFAYTIQVIFRQKKLSDIKSDFINNMTHEFKTPIATISLAADAINNPKVQSDKTKMDYFTRIIKEENKRMNSQVENVLQMAQLEKGEMNLKISDLNLHAIIQNAVDLITIQVESNGGKIEQHLNASIPLLKGDQIHLSNVIFNLLDNANKYSREIPNIVISTYNNNNGIYVTVKDSGIGMHRDTIKKIFEKFYRVPTGNLHDIKGFGLGLSYVKAIVEQHKGKISVESEFGVGSTFEIYLPYSPI